MTYRCWRESCGSRVGAAAAGKRRKRSSRSRRGASPLSVPAAADVLVAPRVHTRKQRVQHTREQCDRHANVTTAPMQNMQTNKR